MSMYSLVSSKIFFFVKVNKFGGVSGVSLCNVYRAKTRHQYDTREKGHMIIQPFPLFH